MSKPVFSYLHQHLMLLPFLVWGIITCAVTSHVVLTCIFLIINEVEHLSYVYLLSAYALWQNIGIFAHFLIGLLSLILNFEISFLNTSLLMDMWTATILSQTEAYFLLASIQKSF